ncbi:SGNH/GDSL hydrolase family protein [Rhodococcus spongiicola]|uniref:SGNH/GDSL hydrolase family protein n=1 Tax=Rhodococcus spongiicola TaxID=2487352 RepID=UPI0013E3ED82|nr:SGNH/GDSL hydrolase family protein [Rhodococcus spongiicola]
MAAALIAAVGMYWAAGERGPSTSYAGTYTPNTGVGPNDPEAPTARLAVIGGSYSAGVGNTVAWPQLLAEKRGWQLDNVATEGTGYTVSGPDGEAAFPTKVDAATANSPDIIIVAGSRNDQTIPGDVEPIASAMFSDLKAKAPNATIVVIGPMWDSSEPSYAVEVANEGTRLAAEAAGLPFVDALELSWLDSPELIQDDSVHPTDDGQHVLAERIDAVVPALTVP